jgi:hypothetical protein
LTQKSQYRKGFIMENNNTNGASRRPDEKNTKNENKSSSQGHGRSRHHHRRPSRPAAENGVQGGAEAVIKQEKPTAEEKAGQKSQQQGGGDRNRSRGGKNRSGQKGKSAELPSEPSNVAAAVSEESRGGKRGRGAKEARNTPAPVAEPSGLATSLRGFDLNDRLFDDSFLPMHEEVRPDPEAEHYAASVLDAEGPLLFRPAETCCADAPSEATESEQTEEPVPIVGVRFRRTGKVYFFDPGAFTLRPGQFVIVETARGLEYGEIYRGNSVVAAKEIVLPLRPVVRVATPEDTRHRPLASVLGASVGGVTDRVGRPVGADGEGLRPVNLHARAGDVARR